jgi:hypothetical protein
LRVAAAAQTNDFATDTTLLGGEFERHECGREKVRRRRGGGGQGVNDWGRKGNLDDSTISLCTTRVKKGMIKAK